MDASKNIAFRYERPAQLDIVAAPTKSVAVIISCRNGHDKLNLTLASLAAQTYPEHLVAVYVIDDGSVPPIEIPEISPTHTTIIKFENSANKWGKAEATNFGTSSLTEDVFWFLDADMVLEPHHLAQHMKWHHHADDYLVLGWKKFVKEWGYSPQDLYAQLMDGGYEALHPVSEVKEQWEALVADTDDLRNANLGSFRTLVGATFSMTRKSWISIGGYNPEFKLGNDTELGWRTLLQGLRYVPERDANSWHLGLTRIETNRELVIAHNLPIFANYMPGVGRLRKGFAFAWKIPDFEVILDCRLMTAESFLKIVNVFEANEEMQARYRLWGPWEILAGRYSVSEDEHEQLRAIYRFAFGDARFTFEDLDSATHLSVNDILSKVNVRSTPFLIFTEGNPDEAILFLGMRTHIIGTGNGLEGVVDPLDQRTFIVFTPALSRARSAGGNLQANIQSGWGLRWDDVGQFDFGRPAPRPSVGQFLKMVRTSLKRKPRLKDVFRLANKALIVLHVKKAK